MMSIMRRRPLPVYSFYETLRTFRYGLSLGVIVGPESATLDIGEHIPINTDHSGLNKCKSREDDLYVKIVTAVRGVYAALQQQSEPIMRWVIGSDDPTRVYKYRTDHERARGELRSSRNLGQWLIESPEFKTWANVSEGSSPTLWLRGGVGTGKTSVTLSASLSLDIISWLTRDR
ncbi:hypothetical protein F5Y13DRAFT_173037 [Hypoxylon sp. FL1857]|nr:hypothetical protein F5Y13DRAFT_173037 [Hypoxylon sp. FL1857]